MLIFSKIKEQINESRATEYVRSLMSHILGIGFEISENRSRYIGQKSQKLESQIRELGKKVVMDSKWL